MSRWIRILACGLVGASMALGSAATAEPPRASEYDVKAAFLYNFARFVEWPAGAFAAAPGSFVICVLGEDPFGQALDGMLAGKSIAGRKLVARRLASREGTQACQILFISGSEADRLRKILKDLADGSILTVSDTDEFAERGGMVQMKLVDDRLRLEINADRAERAGLRMSSHLLALASIRRNGGER